MSLGVTVAGAYNGSSSTNQTLLLSPTDCALSSNRTLYVVSSDERILGFERNNRTSRTVATLTTDGYFLFIDNRTSDIYVSLRYLNLVLILPSNRTIPPDGLNIANCSMNRLCSPSVIVVDSVGNAYISSTNCHMVLKWAPNDTNGTLIAGSPTGQQGSNSQGLIYPLGLALDEPNSFLYVADHGNHRIQRFILGGSGTGVTVAGGNGQGTSQNQLFYPIDIYLSKLDGSIFITDAFNNRIQKWAMNASTGVTIAGSSTGVAGRTAYLLDFPFGLAIDEDETNLFVADFNNQRVQHFPLK